MPYPLPPGGAEGLCTADHSAFHLPLLAVTLVSQGRQRGREERGMADSELSIFINSTSGDSTRLCNKKIQPKISFLHGYCMDTENFFFAWSLWVTIPYPAQCNGCLHNTCITLGSKSKLERIGGGVWVSGAGRSQICADTDRCWYMWIKLVFLSFTFCYGGGGVPT